MIGSLSEQIAKWLKSKKIIEAEDVDVCGYGIFWLLNIIEFLLVSVILGTVLRILPGGARIFYILSFAASFRRRLSHGYGTKMPDNVSRNNNGVHNCGKMTAVQKASFFMLLAAAAGTVVLFILAPTGTGYEDGRITAYRRICRLVCAVSLLTAIIMLVFKVYSAASGIAAGIIAESLLCLAEILKEHRATTK